MALPTGHDLTDGLARDPLDRSPVPCSGHREIRSLALIATDGLAVVASITMVAWIEGLLHAASGPLFVPDDLIMLLVIMFACLALIGRYVEPAPSLASGWRLIGAASFCVAVAEAGAELLTQEGSDPGLLLALFPVFPVLAVLARRLGRRLLASQTRRFSIAATGSDSGLASFHGGLRRPVAWRMKGAIDMALSGALLVLAAPVLLVISALCCLDGGPVFFSHRRIGAGGRSFNCLKFRTMVVDCDHVLEAALAGDPILAQEWQANRKLARDPRVRPLGRFLRSTSLDELPQLLNVLRRDMSLVGPRPIVAGEIGLYGEDIAYYYAARPGLTGLWQVSGRSHTSYSRRVELDVWYVSNWTIQHDLIVMLKTIPAVLQRRGAC